VKKRYIVLVIVVGLIVIGAAAGGGGGPSTKNTADQNGDTGPAASGGSGSGGAKKASVGDSITLDGTTNRMQVTVLKVLDPAPGGQYDQPQNGHRYVGVQVALKNVGTNTYSDAPGNGAKVITASDEQADTTLLEGGPCSGGFSTDARISPGSRLQGCIPFEVPSAARLKTFQLSLDSGFGPQSGEWHLP